MCNQRDGFLRKFRTFFLGIVELGSDLRWFSDDKLKDNVEFWSI